MKHKAHLISNADSTLGALRFSLDLALTCDDNFGACA